MAMRNVLRRPIKSETTPPIKPPVVMAAKSSNYASSAKSYAVGGTDTRPDEEIDNAKYYYEQTKILKEYCDALVSRLNEMQS